MIRAITSVRARLGTCRGVLVDSNVLLDIATNDPNWSDGSGRARAECAEQTTLIINPIIYAEVSIGYTTIEALDAALPTTLYQREPLPWEAGFLAGKCFLAYRRRGGLRISHLPDFYIGAHAAIGHLALLTRDAACYDSYFPTIEILVPTKPQMRCSGQDPRAPSFVLEILAALIHLVVRKMKELPSTSPGFWTHSAV